MTCRKHTNFLSSAKTLAYTFALSLLVLKKAAAVRHIIFRISL
jgi:hypothetical protein